MPSPMVIYHCSVGRPRITCLLEKEHLKAGRESTNANVIAAVCSEKVFTFFVRSGSASDMAGSVELPPSIRGFLDTIS